MNGPQNFRRRVGAAAVAALLLLAWSPQGHAAASGLLPARMSLGGQPAAGFATAGPTYDEQMGVTFTQNFTSLTYNVTAVAQTDANGYGPAYVINGLSSAGYWYQVGISYHWPIVTGGYNPAFGFSYQVFGPNAKPVYPTNGGAGIGALSGAVNSGDIVLLSLTFSGSTVQMLVQDWNTGATAKTSYSSFGSSTFVGLASSAVSGQGFFSGLMTEWYHDAPYSSNIGKVVYSNMAVALSSAWMWVDEFVGTSPSQLLFSNQTNAPVAFENDQQVYTFASNGFTMYGSAHQFIMGVLNAASSRVTLKPATQETAAPSFAATYTLAGLVQNASVDPGVPALVEADAGTSVTVTIGTSGSQERWEFAVAGGTPVTSVTFPAGANVTYVYYHLVHELVSYRVAGGGQLPSSASPELVYYVPPPAASGAPSSVRATLALGTTPVAIFAVLGTNITMPAPIRGAPGEGWAAVGGGAWPVSAPDLVPDPIQLYHQYLVSASYSAAGGSPPQAPRMTFTYLGSSTTVPLSTEQTTFWLDAGSAYNCTSSMGASSSERWTGGGSGVVSSDAMIKGAVDQVVASVIVANYTHQYYASFGANAAAGGSLSQQSGWVEAGKSLALSATASQGWRFEGWEGSGQGAYTGTDPSIDLTVSGPLNESATFFVQLKISADGMTDVAYSSPSGAGTVRAGSATTLYVPPSANVSLDASPTLLIYSFASWEGGGVASARPSFSIMVASPTSVAASSSIDYLALVGLAGALVLAVVLLAVALRGRANRADAPRPSNPSP